jgi:hypothetical protein
LLEHTLEFKLERHPLRPELDELVKKEEVLRKRASNLRTKFNDLSDDDTHTKMDRIRKAHHTLVGIQKQQGALGSKIYAIRQKMLRQIVHEADVVRPLESCVGRTSGTGRRSAQPALPPLVRR